MELQRGRSHGECPGPAEFTVRYFAPYNGQKGPQFNTEQDAIKYLKLLVEGLE